MIIYNICRPNNTVLQMIKRYQNIIISGFIAFLGFILYSTTILLVYPSGMTVTSGDAAIYAGDIEEGDINLNHIGYQIMGRALYLIFKNTFPLVTIVAFISVFFGALSLGFCYLISKKILGSPRDAMLSTLIVMIAGTYWLYSIVIEIYAMHLFFLWSALYFMLDKKTYSSALLFFISLFISLTSVFFAPVLAYIAYKNKSAKRFALCIALSAVLYLSVSYEEIYYVIRGGSTGLHLVAPLANAYYMTQSFLFFLPLALIGTYKIYKKDPGTLKLILFAALPYTYFVFFNWDHGVFLLPIYVFISSLAIYMIRDLVLFKNRYFMGIVYIIFFSLELSLVVSPVVEESAIFDNFIKSSSNCVHGNVLYARYDYGEIYRNVLKSDYESYMMPYNDLKKSIDHVSKEKSVLVLDLEISRIDQKNIRDYYPSILSDYKFNTITCSSMFHTYTKWIGVLQENRYCIYELKNQ